LENIKDDIKDGKSLTPQEEKLRQLKAILPEAFVEGKIDWEKLKATLGEDVNFSNERYVLNWAGKSDAFKVLQIASTKTLAPAKDESVNFDETQNIFIEGENLEVLKVLQKSYFGKVKMIYIDPPYNTGNDSFIYPDNFSESKEEYQKRVGDKDEDGYMIKDGLFQKNSKENGQYHSSWLSMMYPRLFLAKNLLRQDGMIFVSIDDNEIHNLRLLMNEVFGEENFVENIIWKKRYGGGAKEKFLVSVHEYIVCYAKNIDVLSPLFIPQSQESIDRYYTQTDDNFDKRGSYRTHPLEATKSMGDRPNLLFPIISPDGIPIMPKRQWLWSKDRVAEELKKGAIAFIKDKDGNWSVHSKQYLKDDTGNIRQSKAFSIIDDVFTQHGTNEIIDLFGKAQTFSFPKPSKLIHPLLNLGTTSEDEIILDFFAGSGTTAHAVMDLNKKDGGCRKFILVQLPEHCDEKSEAYKSGYKTIADIAKERIRRVIQKINKEINGKIDFENCKQDFGFKVFILADSNFKQWRGDLCKDAESLEKQMKLFVNPVSETATAENMVYELLLKSGKDINSKLEHKDNYYCVNNNELVLMLENINQEIIDAVLKVNPYKVIALDNLFACNDQLKTNTVLQMRDAGIEFKSI
jgi:adenine-specific DNA-methyltransferase